MHMQPLILRHPRERGLASSRSLLIIFLAALIVIALGVYVAVLGPRQVIRCERVAEDTVDCTVRQSLFNLITLDEFNIPGVLAANLDQQCDGAEDCVYALQMYGNNGFVQVSRSYVRDLTLRQKLADTINEFLQNPEAQSVELKDRITSGGNIAAGLVFLALFTLLGVTIWLARRD
jgi:hypothetical protein